MGLGYTGLESSNVDIIGIKVYSSIWLHTPNLIVVSLEPSRCQVGYCWSEGKMSTPLYWFRSHQNFVRGLQGPNNNSRFWPYLERKGERNSIGHIDECLVSFYEYKSYVYKVFSRFLWLHIRSSSLCPKGNKHGSSRRRIQWYWRKVVSRDRD